MHNTTPATFSLAHARRDMRTPYPDWQALHAGHAGIVDETVGTTMRGDGCVLHTCDCGATYREIVPA
jgi:hypothetical protein